MPGTDRHHPRHPRRRHHDRLDRAYRACAAGRRRPADRAEFRPQDRGGRARGRDELAEVREIYIGIEVVRHMASSKPARSTRSTAISRRCSASTRSSAGETVAIIGANGAGKSTYLRAIAGLIARNAPTASSSTAADRRPCRRRRSCGSASRWCPKGGGCFPR